MRDESSPSDGQRGLDGVLDVIAVHDFVDAHALMANGVEECGSISIQDFADRSETEQGMQFANACAEFVGGTASAGVLNGLDCLANTVDGVADRVRKVAIKQEEFEDPVGRE